MNKLLQNLRKRSEAKLYFLTFKDSAGGVVKRYQYTTIDDATRAIALTSYDKINQACAIDFVGCFTSRFRFHIHTIQTDNDYEFQAKSH